MRLAPERPFLYLLDDLKKIRPHSIKISGHYLARVEALFDTVSSQLAGEPSPNLRLSAFETAPLGLPVQTV
jgi:hypothetical protein